jgi:hypothetical protein
MLARKSLPIGVMVMILIVALASLGVVYGHWSKTLFINGIVQTGNVDAELTVTSVTDNEDVKDVGDCDAWLLDPDGDGKMEKLHVEVHDGYPSYECLVVFDVHSVGSIPVHISQPAWTTPPPAEVTALFDPCYLEGTQLHQSDVAYCTLYIHVEQAAAQSTQYEFHASLDAVQFNE